MYNIWLLSLVSFFTDIGTYMVYPLIPIFLSSLGTTPFTIGVIEGIAESLTSLLKFAAGFISDRMNNRKTLAVFGYGFSAVGRVLLVLASSWVGVFLWRVSDRIGKGVRTAPRDALIAESSVKGRHGRSFGLHQTMDMLGAAIGTGIAYAIISRESGSFSTIFHYSMIPVVIGFGFLFWIRESKKDPPAKQKKFAFKWSSLDQRLKHLLLVILLFTLANSSNQFLILRASDAGMPTASVLLLYLVFYLVSSLSSYPAGYFSDRVGRKGLLVSGYLFYGAVYLGFGFIQSNSWFWLLFALYGIYTGLTKGVEKALVADIAPKNLKASAMGMYSMIVGIGLLPASLLTGWLWNEFGTAVPFYFNGGLAILTAILLYLALSKEKQQSNFCEAK